MEETERTRRLNAETETKEARRTLAFRMACDAVYLEGMLARSIGLGLDANPYHEEGVQRHDFDAKDLRLPWMFGWRAADEQEAIDVMLAAARVATRDGTVIPACPSGENLMHAVAAYLARKSGT